MKKIVLTSIVCSFILLSCQKQQDVPNPSDLTGSSRTSEANIPPPPKPFEEGEVYFVSGNNIYCMNNTMLAGNNCEPILIHQNLTEAKIEDITVDVYINKLYWSDSKKGKIFCANPDGSFVKSWPVHNPGQMTIDSFEKKLYWISSSENRYFIYRSNLDGTFREEFMSFNKQNNEPILDIEIPTGSNEIFVTTTLRTFKTDLSTEQITMSTFKAAGYTIDVSSKNTGNKIFLNQGQYIYRMDVEGKNPVNIISDSDYSSNADIAFHDKKGWLYFASAKENHHLLRADEQGNILKEYETYPLNGPVIVVNKN